jgi:hypothetical protein
MNEMHEVERAELEAVEGGAIAVASALQSRLRIVADQLQIDRHRMFELQINFPPPRSVP